MGGGTSNGVAIKRQRKTAKSGHAARRDITADQIVRITLRLIRQGGFASVSMRQIAVELGVSATALYHHFRDKDALLDRVADQIYGSIAAPESTLHWTDRLRQLVLEQQRVSLEHPGLARFVLMRRFESVGAFRWIESILQVLREGGLSEDEAIEGLNQLSFLINPMTFLDVPQRKPHERVFAGDIARRSVVQQMERFPHLASMLDRLPGQLYEDLFASALDRVITGLQATFARSGTVRRPQRKRRSST